MKKLLLIIFILIVISLACKKPLVDHSYGLGVNNKTNDSLVTALSYDYPSLQLPVWNNESAPVRNLAPQSSTGYSSHGSWKGEIQRNAFDTLVVFFIKRDTLMKYGYNQQGYNTIRANNNISGYKFVTLSNLDGKGQNASVDYP
jgi:hypothetical protein